jgi:hypothetical protein
MTKVETIIPNRDRLERKCLVKLLRTHELPTFRA